MLVVAPMLGTYSPNGACRQLACAGTLANDPAAHGEQIVAWRDGFERPIAQSVQVELPDELLNVPKSARNKHLRTEEERFAPQGWHEAEAAALVVPASQSEQRVAPIPPIFTA